MKRHACLGLVAALLGGCAVTSDVKPVMTGDLDGNYAEIADCTFLRLQDRIDAPTTSQLPSRKTVQISQDYAGTVYWTLDISEAGPKKTHFEFRSGPNVFGETSYLKNVLPSLEACRPRK